MNLPVASRCAKRAAVIAATVTLGYVGLVGSASAEPHAPSPCEADVEPVFSTWVDVIELEEGSWHPNTTSLNQDNIQVTHHQGSSGTWTNSASAGTVVGYGGSDISIANSTSDSVTFTVDRTETQTFAVPATQA